MSTPAIQPIIPSCRLRILSDEQLGQLKAATFEILEDTGIHCPSSRILNHYAEHGANADFEKKIVKIGPDIVLEVLSHAPRYYALGARSADYDLALDGRSMYYATDGCGTASVDFVSGQRRASNKEDVAEMAQVVARDTSSMRARLPLSSLICTIVPLAQDKEAMESALGIGSNMLLCALCGAETSNGFGLRENCTLLNFEDLVLDSEFYHQVRVDAAGLDTSREAIAMEVIRELGPGGHYLT